MFSYFKFRSIFTSLRVVFLTISSSSLSLNFLIATTVKILITNFTCFFVPGLVDDAVSALAHDALNFVFVHLIIIQSTIITDGSVGLFITNSLIFIPSSLPDLLGLLYVICGSWN